MLLGLTPLVQGILEAFGNRDIPFSVPVCSDDAEAKALVMQLIDGLGGFKALDAGGVKESKILELLGPNWLVTLMMNNFKPSEGEFPGWRFGL